jgi:hypothetical protein
VSSYLAFSPLPALCCQRTGGIFSVTLSVIAFFNCDARVFYAACRRMVFGLSSSKPKGSPAIICHQQIIYHSQPGRKENLLLRGLQPIQKK